MFRKAAHVAGFTLIELLVVLSIVALLLTITLPRYFNSMDASKESVLVENLRTTREAIDKFYADTARYPESLDELVTKRYLRSLPNDPVLGTSDAWTLIPPAGGATGKGNIYDLKSSADGLSRHGRPFNEL
jgi:general secretion pathway protein G